MDLDDLIVPVGGLLLGAFAMFSGGAGNVEGMMSGGAQIKELRDTAARQEILSGAKNEALASRASIAEQRFQSGCQVHFKRAQIQNPADTAIGAVTVEYVPIREGHVHQHPQTGMPYSPGVTLCDWSGGTAVIGPNGEATDYAYTGSPQVKEWVDLNMGRFRQ
jgi:hypothetical protein